MKPIVQYRIATPDGDIVIETDKGGGAVLNSPFEHDESLFSASVDGMEGLLLALASEGVDVGQEAFVRAVRTTLDHIADVYGD